MLIEVCKAKIAYAEITEAELFYEGSLTVDSLLLEAVDILPGEKVQVVNLNNGSRLDTYVIKGEAGSGIICLNGPAARQGLVGDQIMIICYAHMDREEAVNFQPKIIHLDDGNTIKD